MNSLVDAAHDREGYYDNIFDGRSTVYGRDISLSRRNGMSEEYNKRIFR